MADLAPGATIAGKYKVEQVIAQTLTTTTYGCNSAQGRFFVKVLKSMVAEDREDRGRFEREYAVLNKLRHPCIAQVFGMEDAGGTPCIVMEYLEGETLKALIGHGPLDVRSAVGIGLQLFGALHTAHGQGVVHRDLEPGNLFAVKRDDGAFQLKIFNFGAASTQDAALLSGGELTQAGTIIGSLEYIAPEQARGKTDARSDLYAAGCVMYALLTGAPPFPGAGPVVLVRHAGEPPTALRIKRAEIPAPLDQFVMKLLEKRAEDRFRDAKAARDELYGVGHKVGLAGATPPPVPIAGARAAAAPGAARRATGPVILGRAPASKPAAGGKKEGGCRTYSQADLEWKAPIVGVPKGSRMATLYGDPAREGFFTVRLMIPAGFRLAPHTHAHGEEVTVIAGSIKVGEGPVFDPEGARRLASGGYYFNPAGMPHFAFSDEDVMIQVTGQGPWEFLKPS